MRERTMSKLEKSCCPKCEAKEDSNKQCPGVVHFHCGAYTIDTNFVEAFGEKCKRRMWKKRAKNIKERFDRLCVMFRLHRRKLWLAGPPGHSRLIFDDETEQIIEGTERD